MTSRMTSTTRRVATKPRAVRRVATAGGDGGGVGTPAAGGAGVVTADNVTLLGLMVRHGAAYGSSPTIPWRRGRFPVLSDARVARPAGNAGAQNQASFETAE